MLTMSKTSARFKPQSPQSPPLPPIKLAGKRRSFSSQGGGLLNRMFGSSPASISEDAVHDGEMRPVSAASEASEADSGLRKSPTDEVPPDQRKRRSSSAAKAREIFSSAKQSLHLYSDKNPNSASSQESQRQDRKEREAAAASPIQKLSRTDPALGVPQGPHNNSAGESLPTPQSTFRVGVTEDKNKKCRRTMEDTHAYLYHFLSTPAPPTASEDSPNQATASNAQGVKKEITETDNGYFAIFDGHAGTFAADWCGKKLHHILEETIRKNPNTPIPELLDQTFTSVDQQLEKLPLKNSGCTAVTAVLRWEDRVPNQQSATGSTYLNQASAKAVSEAEKDNATDAQQGSSQSTSMNNGNVSPEKAVAKLVDSASRQRVLYTANVGDARIVLCRNGRALRLSYDHKGSDENEGRRVANAGGLILNNRVNGVLAVTRALGDAYMKDLVTGHPYTTETVIQPDQDEFIILACDGLWDVCSDQEAVDLIRNTSDPQTASKQLVDYALARFSTDNLSCMIVRFDNDALRRQKAEAVIGVAGDAATAATGPSEAQVIVSEAADKLVGGAPPMTGTQIAEQKAEGEPVRASGEGTGPALESIREVQKDAEPGPELNPEALVKAREKKERHVAEIEGGGAQGGAS